MIINLEDAWSLTYKWIRKASLPFVLTFFPFIWAWLNFTSKVGIQRKGEVKHNEPQIQPYNLHRYYSGLTSWAYQPQSLFPIGPLIFSTFTISLNFSFLGMGQNGHDIPFRMDMTRTTQEKLLLVLTHGSPT